MFTIPNEADASVPAQAEPDKVDVDIIAAAAGGTGVVSGCAVTPQGSPDMTLAVAAGVVAVGGVRATVTAGNVTVTAADATDPRFDLVVVDASGAKSVEAGSPDAAPVFPAIPATSAVLAAVYVPATDTAIGGPQIVDKRMPVGVGGMVLLDEVELLADTTQINFTGIPGTFSDLLIVGDVRSAEAAAASFLMMQLGDSAIDTGTNYQYMAWDFTAGGTHTASESGGDDMMRIGRATMPGSTMPAGLFGGIEVRIHDYARTGFARNVQAQAGFRGGASGSARIGQSWGRWANTTDPISKVRFIVEAGSNLVTGSKVRLYGVG